MKKIVFLMIFAVSAFAFGQKVKVKKGIALVDGKEYLKAEEDGAARDCYNISTLDGKELFYLKLNSYKDPKEIDYKTNPDGSVDYFEVLSADLNTVYFETSLTLCLMGCSNVDNFIKMLYAGKAVNADGTLDMAKVEILSKKTGFEYSKKREELGASSSNTVIIQNSSAPAPIRKGINIGIGIGR